MYNYVEITDEEVELQHKELLKICTIKDESLEFVDHYGLGFWLRKYANFPTWLPLYFHGDHGPSLASKILHFELKSIYKVALFHNDFKKNDALKRKFKKVYVVGSPFVHYKNINNLKPENDRKGTICFPYHSTAGVDVHYNWQVYIDELKNLPSEFHPLTICIHFVDIEKGIDKFFLKNGFRVVTAGHKKNIKFTENFYSIIKDKKFSTSNILGSQAFYCTDFGIPFFLYGNKNLIIENSSNKNMAFGKLSLNEYIHTNREMSNFDQATLLFEAFHREISIEQRLFTKKVLGIDIALSPKQLKRIFWKEFFFHIHLYVWSKIKEFYSVIFNYWKWNIRIKIKGIILKNNK